MTEHVEIIQQAVEVIEIARQGLPGPAGPPGDGMLTINFAWGDASPVTLTTMLAGKRVYTVRLIVETPFNGTGASLAVGTVSAPGELMATAENNPGEVGTYETYPDKRYLVNTAVRLTITPGSGASAGAGQVQVEIEP